MSRKKDILGKSFVYKGFRKNLADRFDVLEAKVIWAKANDTLCRFESDYPEITGDARMMILPAAALYKAISDVATGEALDMLKAYGTQMGNKIARIVYGVTSIPGVSVLLWKNMPALMRKMSSPEKGYTREIVSETKELVGVDILSCPLHDAAIRIGVPEAAQVVCAMDKAYMCGFKYIHYTRTTSVAEGDRCCDYRLIFDKSKIGFRNPEPAHQSPSVG